jgi:cutinase
MTSLKTGIVLALACGASAVPLNPMLSIRQFFGGGGSSTRNDLLEGGCKGTIVIFARGTTEMGNVGTVTGPPFFDALSALVSGDLAVQGVDYAAAWSGAMSGGDAAGSQEMYIPVCHGVTDLKGTEQKLTKSTGPIWFSRQSRIAPTPEL